MLCSLEEPVEFRERADGIVNDKFIALDDYGLVHSGPRARKRRRGLQGEAGEGRRPGDAHARRWARAVDGRGAYRERWPKNKSRRDLYYPIKAGRVHFVCRKRRGGNHRRDV